MIVEVSVVITILDLKIGRLSLVSFHVSVHMHNIVISGMNERIGGVTRQSYRSSLAVIVVFHQHKFAGGTESLVELGHTAEVTFP